MTRIKSDNVQFGSSFVVSIEQTSSAAKIKEALSKEQQIILEGQKKAQELLEAAKLQAHQMIEDAKNKANQEVDTIVEQARSEGFEKGREEGLQSITEELQEKILAVENFAQSSFEIKKSIIKSAHLDIIKLIVEISEKICSKSLEIDEKILTEITIQAIQSLKDKENITIIVHPLMAERIYSVSDELKERIPQLSSIKIIEDASVSPDGTIVESPLSRVDCRIKSQINEITDRLMEKLNSTQSEELVHEVSRQSEEETGNREQ